MTKYNLGDSAVLMRISIGMPGKARKDKRLSGQVQTEHSLGKKSGSWVKYKFPDWALEPLETLATEARAYHERVTLPYYKGLGILPGVLIMDYRQTMSDYASKYAGLVQSHFAPRYPEMIEWAKKEHNGTFNARDYPEVAEAVKPFRFETEASPIPGSDHYSNEMKAILGVDTAGIDRRIEDASAKAQKDLLARLMEPVQAMAAKLMEAPKEGRDAVVFRDSLVGNLRDIADIAPALNMGQDPFIAECITAVKALSMNDADRLRKSSSTREQVAKEAAMIAAKMASYAL